MGIVQLTKESVGEEGCDPVRGLTGTKTTCVIEKPGRFSGVTTPPFGSSLEQIPLENNYLTMRDPGDAEVCLWRVVKILGIPEVQPKVVETLCHI